MMYFLVEMPNLQVCVQIDFVISFRAQPVARFGTVLAHHDDRRLDGGQTGENQIEKNERISIKRSGSEQHGVRTDPDEDKSAKCNEKFPTSAELGNAVGEPLAESEFFLELLLDVTGENLVLFQTLDHFLVERGKFADLVFQNLFDVILAEFPQVIEANEPFAVQVWQFLLDELEKGRPDQFRDHSAVRRLRFLANLTHQWRSYGFTHRDFAAEFNWFRAACRFHFESTIVIPKLPRWKNPKYLLSNCTNT